VGGVGENMSAYKMQKLHGDNSLSYLHKYKYYKVYVERDLNKEIIF
jgi:hypothetical protein